MARVRASGDFQCVDCEDTGGAIERDSDGYIVGFKPCACGQQMKVPGFVYHDEPAPSAE